MRVENIDKMTKTELYGVFREHNRVEGINNPIYGVVVFKESNFDKEYPIESRSYIVSSENNAFIDGRISNSIYGSSLDGSDPFVRLDRYDWEAEYCYLVEEQ
jgi:hypothetical protein